MSITSETLTPAENNQFQELAAQLIDGQDEPDERPHSTAIYVASRQLLIADVPLVVRWAFSEGETAILLYTHEAQRFGAIPVRFSVQTT